MQGKNAMFTVWSSAHEKVITTYKQLMTERFKVKLDRNQSCIPIEWTIHKVLEEILASLKTHPLYDNSGNLVFDISSISKLSKIGLTISRLK